MVKSLQYQITDMETVIMLNQPPMTLLNLQITATQARLTDQDYLVFLGRFLDGETQYVSIQNKCKAETGS